MLELSIAIEESLKSSSSIMITHAGLGLYLLWRGRTWVNLAFSCVCQSMNVDGFRVARTRGTTRRTHRFERRGLNVGDLGSQRNTVMEASRRRTHHALQRETPSLTQV
jgi:hypothetical protein